MPTYEYECLKCSHHFERFQSITDEPLKRCPKCRSKIRRLVGTGAGIIFKGSGFYETDYRSSEYQAAAKKEKSEGSSSGAKETKSTDAKSDSKTKAEKKTAKKE